MAEKDDTQLGAEEAAKQPDEQPDEQPSPEKPRKKRRIPWKSMIAVAIILLIGLPIFSLLQPAYYEKTYPELGPRMENWRTSTHAKIECWECHIEPGAVGFVIFSAKAIPAYYSQLIQGPSETNLFDAPDKDACERCHTTFRDVSSSGDLLMPHRAHVDALDINCPVCHEALVHVVSEQGRNTPAMEICLECHDGEQASAECESCHTRKNVPEDHLREDWLEVHAEMTEVVDCDECHAWSPDYCAECHAERPVSHEGNWKNDHQYPALERGHGGCFACHDEAQCSECHDASETFADQVEE